MKNILLFVLLILIFQVSNAQEKIIRKNNLNGFFYEEYEVLKSDKKNKNGIYEIVNSSSKKALAVGKYNNNKPVGNWYYYNTKGDLIQRFNYDSNTLFFNQSSENPSLTYKFKYELQEDDQVIYPIKIGGDFIGLDFINTKLNSSVGNYIYNYGDENSVISNKLLINEDGVLIEWKTEVQIGTHIQEFYNSIKNLNDYNLNFIPAKVNGMPVQCYIYIESKIKFRGKNKSTY